MTPKYHEKVRDFHPGTNACEEFNFQNKTFTLQPSYLVSKEEGLFSTDKTENQYLSLFLKIIIEFHITDIK